MANIVEKQEYICVDVKSNHNKFWNYELYDSDDVICKWGRCGYGSSSQEKSFPGAGRSFVQQKIREKEKKGYRKLNTIDSKNDNSSTVSVTSKELVKIAKSQIIFSSPIVEKLVEYLTQTNAHNIYEATGGKITYDTSAGTFKTPRGIVTKDNIDAARNILTTIGNFVQNGDYTNRKFVSSLEDYMSLIPMKIGMKFVPEAIFPDQQSVINQNSVLDSLEASFNACLAAPKDEKKDKTEAPKLFDVTLEMVEDKKVIDKIEKFYYSTLNKMHVSSKLKPKYFYFVNIKSVTENFDKKGKPIGNIHELWHGTKCSSLLSILKSGLIIPPSTSSFVTGRLYGDGVYAAPTSTKALNYATNFWGGRDEKRYFMFVLDMAMGTPFIPYGKYGVSYPVKGYDSTWAKSGQSGVINDECIVYKTSQVKIKYLIEFE